MKLCYNLHGDYMPAIYTHNVFAKNVYNNLDKKIQDTFKKSNNIYEIFAQSFDFLFYYNFLSLKPGRKIRKFGRYCHKNNTQDYLINIISYIKKNKLYNNPDILAYLFGSINHYALDTTMHPYINYLSKLPKDNIGIHTKLEFEIDAYYYEKLNNKPFYNYDLPKDLLKKTKFSKKLVKSIDDVFKKTYNMDNIGKIYEKSYNQSRYIFNLAMKDRYGIKKFIYRILDLILVHFKIKSIYCSLYIRNIDTSFLNKDNKEWYNPRNKNLKYNYSWDELFEKAQNQSLMIINLCHKFFKNQTSLKKIKEAIPNISYSNGLPLKTN